MRNANVASGRSFYVLCCATVVPMPRLPGSRRARGPVIHALRVARGMSLAQLSDLTELKFGAGHLSRIENQQYVASQKLSARLAEALDVPLDVVTGQVPPITTLREILALSEDDLAAAANLTVARLRRVERGSERPHQDELALIARRLGVDPAALDSSGAPEPVAS